MRTAIVTGAASGIGRATAERFGAEGCAVLCADIEGCEATMEALHRQGVEARAARVDVADEASCAAMVDAAMGWTGRIDVAAANAGIMVEGDVLSVSIEDWHRVMAVNATGAFLTARATLPHLIETEGALVFTASTVGLSGMKGVAAYSASKGAVVALTRQLAADFADRRVRVNEVAPGAVRTPLSEDQFRARARDDAHFDELLDGVIARYPLSRWGTTREIAETIAFLASDRAGWITGQVIPVDGGLLETR
ncbi:SDR family NAD(P)-dependent oxidoreductase [uncultured Jannaschia sp.]|uniref:SDR family NAD(P)-dependent oxidoreductase n=1 Tax=uncultured Jannaschia sp. TaxID=293347 RepID=UPI002630EDA2|nr:SDR family NAD(P)-dependent oxidoreductase [uncultured Jannaschia sp.]